MLEAIKGDLPDIRDASRVCRMLRRALMSGYRRVGWETIVPEIVSGHAPDGTPTRAAHLAIMPMAFVGSAHADGRVFGLALIPPACMALGEIPGFRRAFESVAPYDYGEERRVLELAKLQSRHRLWLAPAEVGGKHSLSPLPYLQRGRVWASVTPMVLDRHLKKGTGAEVRKLIAQSCENAGLPRPDPLRIRSGMQSSVKGVPPVNTRRGSPEKQRWLVPESAASRFLVHAVIDFEREVHGPVLLGAGRYNGLGCFRRSGRGE